MYALQNNPSMDERLSMSHSFFMSFIISLSSIISSHIVVLILLETVIDILSIELENSILYVKSLQGVPKKRVSRLEADWEPFQIKKLYKIDPC